MRAYLIALITVTDDAWVGRYLAEVPGLVERHGGRYLARGGKHRALEGDVTDPNVVALLEFPDTPSLDAFLADPDYAPHLEARKNGSVSRFFAVEGTDIAGALPDLPKA